MINFRKKDGEGRLFGHSSGDIGVIAIALMFTAAGLYLCFVSFTVPKTVKPLPPKPSSEVSVGIEPSHK
ncbi:MAG TPA: hypothetical protein VIJ72_00570 [Rhizomicrobium sp.]